METELVPGTQAATAAGHNIFMFMSTACMHVCLDADLSRVGYPKVNAGSNGDDDDDDELMLNVLRCHLTY